MNNHTYRRNVAMKAVVGRPREDVTYAVFTEFLIEHKNPGDRFIIYPQLSLKWKPQDESDRRAEVPDVGVGQSTSCRLLPRTP